MTTQLTSNTKARKVTECLSKLQGEYMVEGSARSLKIADTLHEFNRDALPDVKARLYDILTSND